MDEWAGKLIARVESPYYASQAAKLLRRDNALLTALESPSYAALMSRLPREYSPPKGNNFFGANLIGDYYHTSDSYWVKYCFRGAAARPLVAAALAIRLYGMDHNGRLPATLEELVPGYLPRVPDDPYAVPGVPIRYLPGAQQPCVYSVGENKMDDLAAGVWTVPLTVTPDVRYTLPDVIWFVGPPAPQATPATQGAAGGL